MYSFLLRIDSLAQDRGQGMILVQHHCNLAIARAENNFDMQPDQCPKPRFGIGDGAHGSQHALLVISMAWFMISNRISSLLWK